MADFKNLVTTAELAQEKGLGLTHLRKIYAENLDTKPKPVRIEKTTAYFDKEEMLSWLDSLCRPDTLQCIDKALARRFLRGEFARQEQQDSYRLKLIRAQHFPPVRSERVHLAGEGKL